MPVRTVLAALALAASALHSGAAAPRPQTLYQAPPHQQIAAFAQDGPFLAWFAPSAKSCNVVHVLALANGGQVRLPDETANAPNVTCHWVVVPPVRLALAESADNVLWTLREPAPVPFDYVLGAGGADPLERRFAEVAHGKTGIGLWLGGVAGAGTTLAYSAADVEYANQLGCLSGGSCKRRIAGGGVYVVSGGEERVLPGSRPALGLAASSGRIAYIQAAAAPAGPPVANARLPLQVVSATGGSAVCSAQPHGVPLAIALAPDVLAVLARSGKSDRVSWYDASSCATLGSTTVPEGAAPGLVANDHLAVFRVGRTLRGISLRTGKVRTLARATSAPVDLTLAGPRLAWAENRGDTMIMPLTVTSPLGVACV